MHLLKSLAAVQVCDATMYNSCTEARLKMNFKNSPGLGKK